MIEEEGVVDADREAEHHPEDRCDREHVDEPGRRQRGRDTGAEADERRDDRQHGAEGGAQQDDERDRRDQQPERLAGPEDLRHLLDEVLAQDDPHPGDVRPLELGGDRLPGLGRDLELRASNCTTPSAVLPSSETWRMPLGGGQQPAAEVDLLGLRLELGPPGVDLGLLGVDGGQLRLHLGHLQRERRQRLELCASGVELRLPLLELGAGVVDLLLTVGQLLGLLGALLLDRERVDGAAHPVHLGDVLEQRGDAGALVRRQLRAVLAGEHDAAAAAAGVGELLARAGR